MALMAASLAPGGLGVVTYNVAPGCRLREALRDALLIAAAREVSPPRRLEIARRRLAELAEIWNVDDPYRQALRKEAMAQLAKPGEVLFHDEMGEVYAPQRLCDVIAMGREVGLAYVCDADPQLLAGALTPGEGGAPADWEAHEQERDIGEARRFRRSIFTLAPAPIDRRDAPERWDGLWIEGEIARLPSEPGGGRHRFRAGEAGVIELDDDAVARALDDIEAARPAAAAFSEVARGETRPALVRLVANGALRLRAFQNRAATRAPARASVGTLALAMARRGAPVVPTLSGGSLRLGDDAVRALLLLCDGTRDRAALIEEMAKRLSQPAAAVAEDVDAVLERLRRLGMFMA
jgi:hypothetical protein